MVTASAIVAATDKHPIKAFTHYYILLYIHVHVWTLETNSVEQQHLAAQIPYYMSKNILNNAFIYP